MWEVQRKKKFNLFLFNFRSQLYFFFFISNKNILKRRGVSPEYKESIHQGQKQIKCIKYKSP